MTTCASSSRRKSRSRSTAAIRTTSNIPRFDLDICIFRAYENGQPAKIEHFLKWNPKGPSDGELTFVSGHPGRTDRQLTTSELAETRDDEVPYLLSMYNRREVFLHAFGQRAVSKMRGACSTTSAASQNNRKRYEVMSRRLLDPEIWSAIKQREQKLRDAMSANRNSKARSLPTTGSKSAGRNRQDPAGL